MKAMYSKPEIEIMQVGTYSLLNEISGAGLNDDGRVDDGTHTPKAPGRRPF